MNKPEIQSITIYSDNEEKVIKAEPLSLPTIGKVFKYDEHLYVSETKIKTPLVIKYDEKEVLKLELNGDVLIKGEKVGNCIEAVKAIQLQFKLR